MYEVFDNVTGEQVRTFEKETSASRLCAGLNTEYGIGGRYRVNEIPGPLCSRCCANPNRPDEWLCTKCRDHLAQI